MSLNNLQPREKKLLIISLVLILGVGFYYYLYQPQVKALQQKKKQIKEGIQELKLKKIKLLRKEKVEKSYQLLQQELNKEKQKFLDLEDKTRLIMDLSDAAIENNLNLISTAPQPIIKEDIYFRIPVRINLSGKYSDIIAFAADIESLSYLTRVKSLNISSKLIPTNEVQAEMKLTSYALDKSSGDQQ